MTAQQLVLSALRRYGVGARRLRPLADRVVRVDGDDGRTFALRCRPRSDRVFGDIPLELAWMGALRAETEIEPPEPVPGLVGSILEEVDGHDCVLFRWIPGAELAERLSLENMRKLGVLSARLHEHAATFRPTPELPVRTLDRLVRGGEPRSCSNTIMGRSCRRRAVHLRDDRGAVPANRRRAVTLAAADGFRLAVCAVFLPDTTTRVSWSKAHARGVSVRMKLIQRHIAMPALRLLQDDGQRRARRGSASGGLDASASSKRLACRASCSRRMRSSTPAPTC